MPSIEGMSWQRVTQDLLKKASEGLQNIPQPSTSDSEATLVRPSFCIKCSILNLNLYLSHLNMRILHNSRH